MERIASLAREVERVGALLDGLAEPDWKRETRCPPMRVLELAAHVWRGSGRIVEMLDAGPINAEPEKDGATYFQYDVDATSPEVLRRAQQAAAEFASGRALVDAWSGAWPLALARADEAVRSGDPVFPGAFGTIRMSEYLRTRLVEVTVHHMDLRDAFGAEPDPDPGAAEEAAGVLRTLLGTDMRPFGTDDVRFLLVGTGRAQLDDRERESLGPLADMFPLLA